MSAAQVIDLNTSDDETDVDRGQPPVLSRQVGSDDPKKRYRSWAYTHYPASIDESNVLYRRLVCQYHVFGYETCPTTGRLHFQGTIVFAEGKTVTAMKKFLPFQDHFNPCIDVHASITYCKKGGDFFEVGKPPATKKEQGDGERDRWGTALAHARAGRINEIEPQIAFVHARTVDYIHQRELRSAPLSDHTGQPLWLWGPSGAGKSRWARANFPDAYLKPCNKWWDGYTGQKDVLIEDFDRDHACLVHHLKIWGDRYPFPAEVKGSAIKIRPNGQLIITSNYHPSDIWSESGDLEPILRRFKIGQFALVDGCCSNPEWDQARAPLLVLHRDSVTGAPKRIRHVTFRPPTPVPFNKAFMVEDSDDEEDPILQNAARDLKAARTAAIVEKILGSSEEEYMKDRSVIIGMPKVDRGTVIEDVPPTQPLPDEGSYESTYVRRAGNDTMETHTADGRVF